ncbi:unnamed protein product [Staurois parvus]|uniref:Uncharacterized protein n=1 Tax=Staurois parvus TaxID=386267 RepID=A0ABN9FN89_9NEOB|nr:unnamed protein product [Staurois parvus]
MRGVPFLVMANKQDLASARKPTELAEELGLTKMKGHQWHVQGCCAVNGEGLVEGLEVLTNLMKQFQKNRTKFLSIHYIYSFFHLRRKRSLQHKYCILSACSSQAKERRNCARWSSPP